MMTSSVPAGLLQCWQFDVAAQSRYCVLPDGCRDLIFLRDADGRWQAKISSLDESAYLVDTGGRQHFRGYRFRPAARFDAAALLEAVGSVRDFDNSTDDARIYEIIDELVSLDARVDAALTALSLATAVSAAARETGVSERTLERLLRKETGRPPSFWKSLARVRRAAATVVTVAESLAETAAAHGYADQAHMTREFTRWLGATPLQFKNSSALSAALLPGYG